MFQVQRTDDLLNNMDPLRVIAKDFTDFQLFLSKKGVVLIYDDIPPEYLKIVGQLPTIAMNILRPGRGHMLSWTVTGETWPEDVTYERVVKEKGVGFEPGDEIPGSIRTTAWAFMGRKFPKTMVD